MAAADSSDRRAAEISSSILQTLLGGHHPRTYAVRLWDGTTWEAEAGQTARFTMVIRHPGAIRKMFSPATELSMGESYIQDAIDIEGDMEGTYAMAAYAVSQQLPVMTKLRLARLLRSLPELPQSTTGRQPVRLKGAEHSLERDRQAVTYHYNTSNEFFKLFLGKAMVYSSAYFKDADESLDEAQENKLDLICRKLRLKRGERFLDIGCGWGALLIHAARHYGVEALGVTLSEPQVLESNRRIQEAGVADRCRAQALDYRLIPGAGAFDKIASIGMVEHVGEAKLPEYFAQAWRLLRPGGAFLNHGIAHAPRRGKRGSFSQAYVFPDGDPVPIWASTRFAEGAGFEIRDVESLREHYMMTLRRWVRNLEAHHAEAVAATDESTYRAWRLFMSASAYQFFTGGYNVYQSLLLKPDEGRSGMPLTRAEWYR